MIFITVGTHEQPFNRLLEYVDNLKYYGKIKEEVIMQTGFSTYIPKNCKWKKFITYNEMKENVSNARIVITHGGPASFIMPLQIGKIPIVVPRKEEFNEHVNNHQVEFVEIVSKRMKCIIPIINIENLEKTINNYESIIASMNYDMKSNNKNFNIKLEKIISSMFL